MDNAFVPAEYDPFRGYEIAGRIVFPGMRPDHSGVVAVRYEANILAVRLVGIEKAVFFGDAAHIRFSQCTQREKCVRKLILSQRIQHIALILRFVQRLF